jgi:hypothetical protein
MIQDLRLEGGQKFLNVGWSGLRGWQERPLPYRAAAAGDSFMRWLGGRMRSFSALAFCLPEAYSVSQSTWLRLSGGWS